MLVVLSGVPHLAAAHEEDQPNAAELERKLQNPITDLMIVQTFATVDQGVGAADENRTAVSLQALLPVRLTQDLNLLSWTQLPLQSLPASSPGGERANGIGDTTQYLLVEPAQVWRLLWGVGAVTLLPTATNTTLGSGVFGLGPAGLLTYQDEWWTLALLAHHVRSVDGAAGRPEVDRTFLKPIVSYTFQTGAAVGLESETTLDWHAPPEDRWLVPLQATFSRVTLVGPVPLNLIFGARWYVASPTGGPTWGLRLAVSFVVSIDREEENRDDGDEAKGRRPEAD